VVIGATLWGSSLCQDGRRCGVVGLSAPGPDCDWSEEPAVGVRPAALDCIVAPSVEVLVRNVSPAAIRSDLGAR
jgi:hypothetical protein